MTAPKPDASETRPETAIINGKVYYDKATSPYFTDIHGGVRP